MHEFENDAIRKANLIKEGKRKAYSEEEFLELLEKKDCEKNGIPHERHVVFSIVYVLHHEAYSDNQYQ